MGRDTRFEASSGGSPGPLVLALGPTNTGKTHRAIERMLEHDSGMLGLPLRLLAREVYDKVTAQLGERRVALVTGEEKRIPKHPDYWICTVEAMPRQLEVDFLAVDEIQLLSHPQRGHVFSDRLLHARGRKETWFLGSHSAGSLLSSLVPSAKRTERPRLSRLSHIGAHSLGALPPKSAVVAFNSAQVYEVAERVRARKGGAAVILGALSPRTRNAQVAMFQAGEVDYLVATDAIGMGLNLSLNHVAFASLSKFDGQQMRPLSPGELAQIAGRAGRHTQDGSFGTLEPCPRLPEGLARQIELHHLPAERCAEWRNSNLQFESLQSLLESLAQKPKHPRLRLVASPLDMLALHNLSQRPHVRSLATSEHEVELLWQVCQVPDYRKLLPEAHAELLFSVYSQLCGPEGKISEDWLKERVERLDAVDGDLESLLGRIAFVRTWTYVAHQPGWVAQAETWQARTREIEDRLSDALHDRLVQRFVERTKKHVAFTSRPQRTASKSADASAQLGELDWPLSGPFAKLAGLRAQLSNVHPSTPAAVESWVDAPHEAFTFERDGSIRHADVVLGKLRRGRSLIEPELRVEPSLRGGDAWRIERRLRALLHDWLHELLQPLQQLPGDSAALRGVLYQLKCALGTLPAARPAAELELLGADEREQLCQRAIVVGAHHVYARALLDERALHARALLSAAYFELKPSDLPQPDEPRAARRNGIPDAALLAAGYVTVGTNWLRCDLAQISESSGIRTRRRRRRRHKPRASPQ